MATGRRRCSLALRGQDRTDGPTDRLSRGRVVLSSILNCIDPVLTSEDMAPPPAAPPSSPTALGGGPPAVKRSTVKWLEP